MARNNGRLLSALVALSLFACSSSVGDDDDEQERATDTPSARDDEFDAAMPERRRDAQAMDPGTSSQRDAGAAMRDAAVTAMRDTGVRGTSDAGEPSAAVDSGARVDAGSTQAPGARPSAGCGKAARPSGGRVSVPGDHIYTFPSTYDGTAPFPLLIGFHAANNPIDHIETLTKGSDFEKSYVRAFPKSKGSAWDYDTDIAKVLALYDDLMANHCIDRSRVYATGHSSGAQLIVQLLTPTRRADADRLQLRAVAPVAASRYGAVSRAIPVLYIQGKRDSVRRSDGSDVVREFVAANGCQTTSTAFEQVPSCTSSGMSVTDGCVQYNGCKASTLWCSHDDPNYSDTNHGWPCFATKTMYDFFASLP